jgi:hypothetical protein
LAVKLLYDSGIYPYIGYININPNTTSEKFVDGLHFLHENLQASFFHNITSTLNFYEGTTAYTKFRSQGNSSTEFDIGDDFYVNNKIKKMFDFVTPLLGQEILIQDYIDYEASFHIYCNRLVDGVIFREYNSIKRKVNDNNFVFSINVIDLLEKPNNFNALLNLISELKNATSHTLVEYSHILKQIVQQSHYVNKTSIDYIFRYFEQK